MFEHVDYVIFEDAVSYLEQEEESIDRIDNYIDENEFLEPNESKGPNIRKNFPETFVWDTIEYVLFSLAKKPLKNFYCECCQCEN